MRGDSRRKPVGDFKICSPGKNQSLVLRFALWKRSGPSAIEKQLLAGGVDSVEV